MLFLIEQIFSEDGELMEYFENACDVLSFLTYYGWVCNRNRSVLRSCVVVPDSSYSGVSALFPLLSPVFWVFFVMSIDRANR